MRAASRSAARPSAASATTVMIAAIGTALSVPAAPTSGATGGTDHELAHAEQRRGRPRDGGVVVERERGRVREHERQARHDDEHRHEDRHHPEAADRHHHEQRARRDRDRDQSRPQQVGRAEAADEPRVDLAARDQPQPVHREQHAVELRRDAVDALEHERGAGDVGEQRAEPEPAREPVPDEPAVAQQRAHRPQRLGQPAVGAARLRQRLPQPERDEQRDQRRQHRQDPEDPAPRRVVRAPGHRRAARGSAPARSRA